MPYARITDLPASVRHHLPAHAQEIYCAAFNSAWDDYAADPTREEIAHRLAWSAVKLSYEKVDGEWIPVVARRP